MPTHRPSLSTSPFNTMAGDYLRFKRRKLGLTQAEFARQLSWYVGLPISAASVLCYEAGKNTTPAAVLLAAQSMNPPRRRKHANRDRAAVPV